MLLLFLNCSLTLPVFPLAAFLVEKLAQKKHLSDPVSDFQAYQLCPNVYFVFGLSFVLASTQYLTFGPAY